MSALVIQHPFILPANVGLFGKRNCSLGNASCGGPWANPENKEGELTFIRKKGKLGGTVLTKESIDRSWECKV